MTDGSIVHSRGGRNGSEPLFSDEMAETILEKVAAGQSLSSICKPEHMPSDTAVRKWADANINGFGLRFERALRIGAHARGDQVIDIADEKPPVFANAWEAAAFEQQRKARMDARKWHNAKIDPKIWGDNKVVDLRVTVPAVEMTRDELNAIAAEAGLVIDHQPIADESDTTSA